MTARRVAAAVLAAAVVVVVLVVGTGLGWWNGKPAAAAPAHPLVVRTSLGPRPAFYGDPLVAEIDVDVDPSVVSTRSVRVAPSFDPYAETGSPEVAETRAGGRATVSFRYTLQCVSDSCLPVGKPFPLQLPPVTVTATSGVRTLKMMSPWPESFVASRLSKADVNRTHFRRPTTMPPPSYSVSPGITADALTGAAGVLALGALGLIGLELRRLLERRRRRGLVKLTPLEAALAYTREAARRPDAADRRKALALLAETLDSEGAPTLADTAGDVAWSEDPPSPDRALELADEVEGATRDGR